MRSLALAILMITAAPALARPMRARFEPTDLELEKPGVLDVDLQVGYLYGVQSRLMLPDFEVDLGITRRFEIDLDGAYAIDPRTAAGDAAPDNLWLAGKIGVFDLRWEHFMFSGGVQLGPRLPVAHGAVGVGFDGLLLVGLAFNRTHLVLNLGGYIDPGQPTMDPTKTARPIGVQLGLAVDVDLTRDGRFGFHGELGGVVGVAVDPSQVVLAAGLVFSPNDNLDLSILALVGLLPGADRAGGMLGVSPKLVLWR